MRFFKSEVLSVAFNTRYPDERVVTQRTSTEELKEVFNKDYICATYKDNKRARENFVVSNCLAFDCDNDHSDDPNTWMTIDNIIKEFAGVFMVFHMSRNNMKEKNGKAEKRFDFVFFNNFGTVFACECNFYGSSGSKLNETARSYKTLALEAKNIPNFQFVWFTDGIGWNSAKNNLEETFDVLEDVYNLHDLENGAIETLIEPTKYLKKLLK